MNAIDGDTGVGGEVQYRVIPSWGSDRFSINQNNGLVRLNGALNYEDVSSSVSYLTDSSALNITVFSYRAWKASLVSIIAISGSRTLLTSLQLLYSL